MSITPGTQFIQLLSYHHPQAQAWIRGDNRNPMISGLANFYQTAYGGILVEIEIFNLPYPANRYPAAFYGLHIHENGDCSPPFDKTGGHYNPGNTPHPYHAGDLPPLIGNQGYAWLSYYTTAFTIDEIIEKSIVVHEKRDDFTTQPSGDSRNKIACGDIRRIK